MKNWRELLSYPQCVAPDVAAWLDIILELMGMPDIEDRYVAMSDFIEQGYTEGLITRREYNVIRGDIAQQI